MHFAESSLYSSFSLPSLDTILVACNFSENTRNFDYNDIGDGRILINNYKDINLNDMKLRPFEAFAILF